MRSSHGQCDGNGGIRFRLKSKKIYKMEEIFKGVASGESASTIFFIPRALTSVFFFSFFFWFLFCVCSCNSTPALMSGWIHEPHSIHSTFWISHTCSTPWNKKVSNKENTGIKATGAVELVSHLPCMLSPTPELYSAIRNIKSLNTTVFI